MQFTCENCQRRYQLPDDKVRGRSVKVRCKSCGHLTTVAAAPEPAPAAATNPFDADESTSVASSEQISQLRAAAARPAPAPPKRSGVKMDVSAQWFAMVKGAQVGPLDVGMVGAKFQSGELHARTYMWKQGMGEWKRADEIAELGPVIRPAAAAPPPPPPAPPAPPPAPARSSSRVAVPIAEPKPAPEPEIRDEPLLDAQFEAASGKGKPQPQAPSASLDTLFSDEDLPPTDPRQTSPRKKKKEEPEEDPFAKLGDLDPSQQAPPGEATRFFMQQAGVNKGQRNPPWKIALFVVAFIGLPVGVLYLLSELKVVPLTVTSTNDKGEKVESSVFSGAGVSGIGELLLGKNKKEQPPKVEEPLKPKLPPKKDPNAVAKQEPEPQKDPNQPSQEDLAALYQDTRIDSKGPKLKIQAEKPSYDKGAGGLDEEQVVKVVGQSQSAFQNCIETELKKNPNMKVGKIVIAATVAPSGTVTKADIDRKDVSMSNLGECLKSRARRMVFSSFEGDETELQIPLMVTSSF